MRLKSFYAKTMTEAMKMVREALGEDAIIVATREEKGGPSATGGGVRVTAAIDNAYGDYAQDFHDDFGDEHYDDDFHDDGFQEPPAFEPETDTRQNSKSAWLQYDDENESSAITEDITDAMLRHNVPEEVMDHILSCATVVGMETAGVALMAALEHLFHFTPLPAQAAPKALMMAGPPGAGKTLAAAKIAARGAMNGLNIGVISTDTVRAGGIEQLRSFTDLMRIDLQKAQSPQDLSMILDDLSHCDQVIIDTSGINPFDKDDVRGLAKLIGAGDITPYLVLPAGTDAEESGEMARVFGTIGAQSVLPTRIDIARRLGGLLSAVHQGGLSFADASNTPKVADGLISLSPKTMAKLLLPAAFRDRDSHDKMINRTTSPIRKTGRA